MGHSRKRVEDPRFIRGAGEYIEDVNLPGQLWLDIVRSPYAHATIKGIDAVRGAEGPGCAGGDHRQGSREGRPPLDADARRRQADGAADDTVLFQAQEVAAVVATSRSRRPTAWPRSWSTTSRCR